jgi:hypothetical protein
MPIDTRTSRAALCVAIAVFSTVLAAVAALGPPVVLLASWALVPQCPVVPLPRITMSVSDEQTTALLSLRLSRPPPTPLVTA